MSVREPRRRGGEAPPRPEAAGEDFAASLEEVFVGELRERLRGVPPQLELLGASTTRAVACHQLNRIFHTIKGSAALIGKHDLADAAFALEKLFAAPIALERGALGGAQERLDLLYSAAQAEAPSLCDALPAAPAAVTAEPDAELLEAFALDAGQALQRCESLLMRLDEHPAERALLSDVFRQLHTLKGAASAVGLETIASSAHRVESLLEAELERDAGEVSRELLDDLLESTAALGRRVRETLAGAEENATNPAPAATGGEPRSVTDPAPALDLEGGVRVPMESLDSLLEQVSQLMVNRIQVEQQVRLFGDLREKLHTCRRRLEETAQGFDRRLEDRLWEDSGAPTRASTDADDRFFTELEFDKYDDISVLSRSVIEAANDAGEIAGELGRLIDRLSDQARQFSKLTGGMQRQIAGLRRVPLEAVFRRLRRSARDVARRAGKKVEVRFAGGDVQVDRALAEAVHGPLLHLVGNAIVHGVETPAARAGRGKRETGRVAVAAAYEGVGLELTVHDDGAGLDLDAIARRAGELGLLPDSEPTKDDLVAVLFRDGFTTSAETSRLAGRGVGLSAVAREIAALHGTVRVDTEPQAGTCFRLTVPITTALDEALLVEAGSQTLALSVRSVECAVPVEMSALRRSGERCELALDGKSMPALTLADWIGEVPPADGAVAVVVRAGPERVAMVVDRVRAQQDVAVRPLDPVLRRHPFLRGAAISGLGTVVFVLDPDRLCEGVVRAPWPERSTAPEVAAVSPAREQGPRAVLVVDDSISVRKLAARFLESEGIEVDTAVDGVDAIEKLAHDRFRVVVTDLEMPRMHGYELIAAMRQHPRWRRIPIIVCTSRSSTKHRQRAQEMGASGYLTKPFTKEQLVESISRLWSQGGGAREPGARWSGAAPGGAAVTDDEGGPDVRSLGDR